MDEMKAINRIIIMAIKEYRSTSREAMAKLLSDLQCYMELNDGRKLQKWHNNFTWLK